MSFDAIDHPRGRLGKFTVKGQSDPEVGFSAWGSNDVTDFADVTTILTLHPRTQDEMFDAFDGSTGEPGEAVRRIRIGSGFMHLDNAEVRGPVDGRPLLIDIEPDAGAGSIDIVSGNVIVRVNSNHPFDVRVCGESEAMVIVAYGCSSMVEAAENAQVTVVVEDDARGCLSFTSAEARGDVHSSSHKFHERPFLIL